MIHMTFAMSDRPRYRTPRAFCLPRFGASLRRTCIISLLGCAWTFSPFDSAWAAKAPSDAEHSTPVNTYRYIIQTGDTCVSIANRELSEYGSISDIHALNPELGDQTPHRLTPGQVLTLPLPNAPDAEIMSVVHDVRARLGELMPWEAAEPGFTVFRGGRVNTLSASFADLKFSDTSTLSMEENTLVIVYHSREATHASQRLHAELRHGTLRARLAELRGQPRQLDLETPSANTRLDGGNSLVAVSTEGTSRVENHGNGSAIVRSADGRGRVYLAQGTGTRVRRGELPMKPRPLPPSPTWDKAAKLVLALPGTTSIARGSWHSVKEAQAYRIELRQQTSQDKPLELRNAYLVPANTQNYELRGLIPGRYRITVATVDAEGFTSIPSPEHEIEIIAADLQFGGQQLEAQGVDDTKLSLADRPIKVPVGTRLIPPSGFECLSATLALGNHNGLREPGIHEVQCEHPSSGQSVPVRIEVSKPNLIFPDGKPVTELIVQNASTKHFVVDLQSDVAIPGELKIRSSKGARIVHQASHLFGNKLRIEFELELQNSERHGTLEVLAVAATKEPIVLATLPWLREETRIDEIRVPVTTSAKPSRWHIELGASTSLWHPAQNIELFQRAVAQDASYRDFVGLGALRFAVFPIPALGVTLEQRVGWSRTRSGDPLRFYGGGVSVFVQHPGWRVSPTLGFGGGVFGVFSDENAHGNDIDPYLAPTLGVRVRLSDAWYLSAESVHQLSAASTPSRSHALRAYSPQFGIELRYAFALRRRLSH